MASIQIKDSDGSEQGGRSWGREKWLYFEDRSSKICSCIGWEISNKRGLKEDSKVFGLRNWKHDVVFTEVGQAVGRAAWKEVLRWTCIIHYTFTWVCLVGSWHMNMEFGREILGIYINLGSRTIYIHIWMYMYIYKQYVCIYTICICIYTHRHTYTYIQKSRKWAWLKIET